MHYNILQFLHLSLDCIGLSSVPGLEVGGYLDSMLNTVPSLYYASVVGSFLLLAWAYHRHKERLQRPPEPEPDPAPGSEQEQEPVSFEISATDECEFVPLVSEEEDRRIAAEIAPKSKYMELDPNQPGAHLNMYLDVLHGAASDTEDEAEVDTAREFRHEDLGQYVTEKDLHALDDPRESPSRRGSVMTRVKKARQRALRNAVERGMSADDRMKEQMAANQMLSRVYTLMRENQEMFGDTSFDQVKSQMDLYKA